MTTKHPWVPFWETDFWADPDLQRRHAPFPQQNWAFSHTQGVPIILEGKWSCEKDDKGRITGWKQDPSKVRNYDNDLPLTWDLVKAAVADARANGISLKEAVAKRVDPEDPRFPRQFFINFAAAPEVMVAPVGVVEDQKTQRQNEAAAAEFWAKIKQGTKKPAPGATAKA